MSNTIKATKRSAIGKGGARKARKAGFVPAIMYGALETPVPLSLPEKDLALLISSEGESGLIDVLIEDDKGKKVGSEKAVIRQIDYHPISDKPIHVDFMAVSMDKLLTISVPVELVGDPIGVTRNKGMMSQITYEITVECLPGNIPHNIQVDVSGLDIGQAVHVGDLAALEGIKFLTGKEMTIVTVEAPRAEEEVPGAAVVEEAVAEPEVIGKKKEEAEEA
jgi:large subunit ribosomal protein L25